jgi:DNA polymerase III delta prime subunit
VFENIIGQSEVVAALREELEASSLPPALLFSGPIYSGKLSTALEVARVLLCEEGKGQWDCRCSACEQQRLLVHRGILLLGPRYFLLEILASADVLRRNQNAASQYLFIRSVRKLLRRFDAVLWEDDSSRIKQALPLVVNVQQALESLTPGVDLSCVQDLDRELESITSQCGSMISYLPAENIPINQIRRMCQWCHMSSPSRRKVVILENADKMQEGSRNALLKILEEPPEDTHLLLLTTRKGLLIQTVLSRLRSYSFPPRSADDQLAVLRTIFKESKESYKDLREYFLAWKGINPTELREVARRFMHMIVSEDNGIESLLDEIQDNLSGTSAIEYLGSFGEELLLLLRSQLYGGAVGLDRIEQWAGLLQSSLRQMGGMNLNPSLVLESLFYRMKEAI